MWCWNPARRSSHSNAPERICNHVNNRCVLAPTVFQMSNLWGKLGRSKVLLWRKRNFYFVKIKYFCFQHNFKTIQVLTAVLENVCLKNLNIKLLQTCNKFVFSLTVKLFFTEQWNILRKTPRRIVQTKMF